MEKITITIIAMISFLWGTTVEAEPREALSMLVKRSVHAPRLARRPKPLRMGPRSRVGWGKGETLTFSVRLAGISVGRAAISVGPPRKKNGRRVLTLRGRGETVPFISTFTKMKEDMVTDIDLAGLVPVRSINDRSARGKDRWLETVYGPVIKQTIRRKMRTRKRLRRLGQPVFDPISALFYLRSINLRPGARRTLVVLNGNSLYRVAVRVTGKERIYSRVGPRSAIRLDGVAHRIRDDHAVLKHKKPRRLTIWFSTDSMRIPLKLRGDTKLGPLEADLSSHRPTRRRLLVRACSVPKK